MAKKKEPIVVNTEPLSITVLGSTAKKKGSAGFLLVIFTLLVLAILFYPNIEPYIDELLHGKDTGTPIIVPETPEPEEKKITKLVCKSGVTTLTYTNSDDGITKITEKIQLPVSESDYLDKYMAQVDVMSKYNELDGYKATMSMESQETVFTYVIDLKKADLTKAKSKYYYPLNTAIEEIKEAMSKEGYKCKEG